jgi:hypothetical protein
MVVKIVIILFLLAILASLGFGLFSLVKDETGSTRTVKALTVRISLSLGLFILLLLAFATGLIQPHGL